MPLQPSPCPVRLCSSWWKPHWTRSSFPEFTSKTRSGWLHSFHPCTPPLSSASTTLSWRTLPTALHPQKWEHYLRVSSGNLRALNLSLIWAGTLSITRPGYAKPSSACSYHSGRVCLPQVRDCPLTLQSVKSEFFGRKKVKTPNPCINDLCSLSLSLDSQTELCSSVFSYATQVPLSGQSRPLLMSRLRNLMERVRVKRRVIPGNICSDFRQIPWDNIVLVFIDQKLRDWQIPGPPAFEGEDSFYTAQYIWWPV